MAVSEELGFAREQQSRTEATQQTKASFFSPPSSSSSNK